MKTITMKYRLLLLLGAFLCLSLSISCEKKDDNKDIPGTDVALKTPQDLSYKVLGTTVKLAWRGQTEVASFDLELSTDESFTAPVRYEVTASSYTIEALAVNTDYWARVKAIAKNVTFNSNFSEGIKFTTGVENILFATPKDVKDKSMTLQWLPGAEVTHFSVTPEGGQAGTYTILSEEKSLGEKMIDELVPETTYYVVLYNGTNVRGEGEYTTSPLIMPDLEVTLSNVTPVSFNLSWDAAEEVTHFVLDPAPITGGATLTLTAGDISAGSVTVLNLMPATSYTVAAYYNASTRGDTVFETGNFADVILTASNVEEESATIAWTPADEYISSISFEPASGSAKTYTVTEADAAGRSYTGLTAATSYTVNLLYVYGGSTYTRGSETFTTASGGGGQTIEWNMSDAAFSGLGDIATETTVNGLTIIPATSGTATVSVDGNDKTAGGYTFTHRLKLGGTGSSTNRALKFDVTGACTITVYALSSSSGSDRQLALSDGTNEITTIAAPGSSTTLETYNYTGGAGTLYLYSKNSGVNVYLVKIEYSSTPPTPAPVEWNMSDAAFSGLGDIATETTVNGLTIIPAVSVDGSDKTAGGYTFTHRLKLGGTGSSTNRALKFDVTGACTITVYALSSSAGSDRQLALSDGTNEITTIAAPGSSTTLETYNYTGGAGTLYLYSKNSGVNVYLIKIEY